MSETAQILVRHDVDLKTFREEIMPTALPVVLKGLVDGLAGGAAARESPRALADFIRGFDRGSASHRDRKSARDRRPALLSRRHDRPQFHAHARPRSARRSSGCSRWRDDPDAPAMFLESMRTRDFLPRVLRGTPDAAGGRRRSSRASGSAIASRCRRTSTCCTTSPAWSADAGASRCFRPSRLQTCTSGPVDFTPSGTPISMVPLHDPDLARFPRFARSAAPRAAGGTRTRRCDVHSRTAGGITSSR